MIHKSEQINEVLLAQMDVLAVDCGANRQHEGALLNSLTRDGSNNPLLNHSINKTNKFFSNLVFGVSDCWYWRGGTDRDGYGKWGKEKAHRVSWKIFSGAIPANICVLHKCNTRICVNPDHIYLGTQKDNVADSIKAGTFRAPTGRWK